MDQFGGVFANDMHSQKTFIVSPEQQFNETDVVPDDFASGALVVGGVADDEIDPFLGQGFFRFADRAYLRNRLDAVG